MKATLRFDLDDIDQREQFKHAQNGFDYWMKIEEFGESLRALCKYGATDGIKVQELHIADEESTQVVSIDAIRKLYWETMRAE